MLSRFARLEAAAGEALENLTGQVLRVANGAGNKSRKPTHTDWRASDYDAAELDALLDSTDWDDASSGTGQSEWQRAQSSMSRRPRSNRRAGGGDQTSHGRGDPTEWDQDWDAGWETGTWDTNWAESRSGAGGGWGDDGNWDSTGEYEDDDWSRSLVALGAASMAEIPMGRIARVRLVLRERPAATTMLIVFLVGFVLTCLAPLLPLLRVGSDVIDLARRGAHIQSLVAGGAQQLIQPTKLALVRDDVDSIEHDLYEINSVTNILGAPAAALSSTMRNYRLLVRMGYDLTAAADEGLQVGQTLLVPLQGGALSASANNPGLSPADIHRARSVLADAQVRVQDAVAAYRQLTPSALPAQLRPGSKYGNYLALLPTAASLFGEMDTLITIAPGLLGIGQPAQYLVIAMDRSELRAGGGFQGNYGILALVGGKQPADHPLQLHNVYDLDQKYYMANLGPTADTSLAQTNCAAWTASSDFGGPPPAYYGPEPPNYYWWWPVRNFSWCFNWGLRDANLSPDFPTNARTAMSIVQGTPGEMLYPGQLQGAIAFTPALIEDLLLVPGVGPLTLSNYPNDPPVTAANLERQIHCHQLYDPSCLQAIAPNPADRKAYTHLLSTALLNKVKTLHGSALKSVVDAALQAMKTKDLQVYFADPRAELILQQLGLAAQIHTGNGDGFFVVDTNDGGNKANLYVTQHQEDLVTLLPNGGAIHRLQVTTTYDRQGWVYADAGTPEDYNAVMRVYMPGDATILGYDTERPGSTNGFAVPPSDGGDHYLPHPLNVCRADIGFDHCLASPTTLSDVAGRTMVMGLVDVACHDDQHGRPMYYLFAQVLGSPVPACNLDPHVNHETISIEWYTPNAWTPGAAGHGSYSELIQKQPGTEAASAPKSGSAQAVVSSTTSATVFVDTSQLHSSAQSVDWTDLDLRAAALKGATKVFDGPIEGDTIVPYNF